MIIAIFLLIVIFWLNIIARLNNYKKIFLPEYTIYCKSLENDDSIIIFAGLGGDAYKSFSYLDKIQKYNKIYISIPNQRGNVYQIMEKIEAAIDHLLKNKNSQITHIIGYSYGGLCSIVLKNQSHKYNNTQLILIAPGGFYGLTITEYVIRLFSKILYVIYPSNYCKMITNYPLYWNKYKLSDSDILIVSESDAIHNSKAFKNNQNNQNTVIYSKKKDVGHYQIKKIIKNEKIIEGILAGVKLSI